MKNEHGFTLTEVAISLLLVGLLLMAIVGKELGAVQYVERCYHRHVAAKEVARAVDALESSPRSFSYQSWQSEVAQILPKGKGEIISVDHATVVTVHWLDDPAKKVERQVSYQLPETAGSHIHFGDKADQFRTPDHSIS